MDNIFMCEFTIGAQGQYVEPNRHSIMVTGEYSSSSAGGSERMGPNVPKSDVGTSSHIRSLRFPSGLIDFAHASDFRGISEGRSAVTRDV